MEDIQIYLLLTDTSSLLTQTIKLFTRQKYNHISIAFDNELENTYSFGRRKISNPFIGGFVKEDTGSNFFLRSDCAIYSLTITQNEKVKLDELIYKMEADKQIWHYNFLGLITAFFEINWDRENHYFCSQFVATVLSEAGIFKTNKPLSLISPMDILESLPCKLEYEGTLLDYSQDQSLSQLLHYPSSTNHKKKNFS